MKDRYWFGVIYLVVFGISILLYMIPINSPTWIFVLNEHQGFTLDQILASAVGTAFIPSLIISIPFFSILHIRRKYLQPKVNKNTE